MRENLEKQMMNVIYERSDNDFSECTAMSEKCAIVARDYAKRFAAFAYESREGLLIWENENNLHREKDEIFDELMKTFDAQNAE